jgi:thymidylate synthase
MYLPVPPQPDCSTAWLAAVKLVDAHAGHEAHNVIIDIANPVAETTRQNPVVKTVDDFLEGQDKSVTCVANTIFPEALYHRHGAPEFFDAFRDTVLPKVRRSHRWSGYYFERMMHLPTRSGQSINQLWDIVGRIRDDHNRSRNKFELSLFDPERDVDGSPYGGQCLSFLRFKLLPGSEKRLALTALYRNRYYIEKLLGNLIGLGRLMAFVAKEGGVNLGPLTVVSTHAKIDHPGATKHTDIEGLLGACIQASANLRVAE